MRAMVIDDSRAMRFVLGRLLRELGFEISEASHGKEALEQLTDADPPGLLLLDWNMPEMNGLELLKVLRADSRYDGVRVVMVTTETSLSHVKEALEAGADEFVMKPFTREVIQEKLGLMGLA